MADVQRSEPPTPRRLDKAFEEGNFPSSKEFVSGVQFLGFIALVVAFGGAWFFQTLKFTRTLLGRAFSIELTPTSLIALIRQSILPEFVPLMMGGIALVLLVLFAQLSTTRFRLSGSKLLPDINRLNPSTRVGNLFAQNLPLLGQAVLLLPVVALVVYYEIAENLEQILTLPWMNPQAGILRVAATYKVLLWRMSGLFLLVGLIDLVWQRHRFIKKLRMTKQEVREEAKEQQGNPQMKARIRRIQRDLARRKMITEISKATAVIVNPTHYAVAIRYSMNSGGAPKVIAKGKNYLAQKIRKKALDHQIPIVENPPLAQALYKSAEVGQEIPADLYRAVAEILAYIYRLMNGRLPG